MRNLTIKTFALAAVALLAAACVKDKGNYDYRTADELLPIHFDKFEKYMGHSNPVKNGERLTFDIAEYVKNNEKGRYEFEWFAKANTGLGNSRVFAQEDIHNPNFSALIQGMKVGGYNFYLEVKDTVTGLVLVEEPIFVEISGGYGQGFYIAKSTGDGHAQIDLMVDGADAVLPNILKSDRPLPEGDPFKFGYLSYYGSDMLELDENNQPTGKTVTVDYSTVSSGHLGAFMLATKDNIYSFDAVTMDPIKTTFEENFYTAAGVERNIEQIQFYDSNVNGTQGPSGPMEVCVHLIIKGKEYVLNLGMRPSAGRFVSPKLAPGGSDYYLHPGIARMYMGYGMNYDNLNSRFMNVFSTTFTYSLYSTDPAAFTSGAKPDGMPNLQDMGLDMVWLGDSGRGAQCTYPTALMKSKTSDEYTLFLPTADYKQAMFNINGIVYSTGSCYPFNRKHTVVPGSKVLDPAALRFMVRGNVDVYYALGNKIYWYRTAPVIDSGDREEELFSIPADETIQTVKTIYNTTSGNNWWGEAVLSNDASGNWHLRAFRTTGLNGVALNKTGIDELQNKPEFHYTGTGKAFDMAYRGSGFAFFNE